jgi:phosphatidylglycerophosphatase A
MTRKPETTSQDSEPDATGPYEPLTTENGWRIGGPDWRKPWPKGLVFLTWFGAGFSFHAPGTVGSLNALPMAVGIAWLGGSRSLILAAIVPFVLGMLYVARYLREEQTPATDPQWIVIDEVVGLWITLAAVPLSFLWYVIGFGLFRFFDIVKPWPIRWVDRNVPGALGVMLDDVIAGLCAAGVLVGLQYLAATYL